jgi:hypothetical protein
MPCHASHRGYLPARRIKFRHRSGTVRAVDLVHGPPGFGRAVGDLVPAGSAASVADQDIAAIQRFGQRVDAGPVGDV